MALTEFVLFELLPGWYCPARRVYCGYAWTLFDSLSYREYNLDEVIDWCAENECDVEPFFSVYVIKPQTADAAFAFRMRWL